MQLKELFADETSRSVTDYVMGLVEQQQALYEEVVEVVFQNEEPYSRRAIWVMDSYDEAHPGIALPYLDSLIDHLEVFDHDGLQRHSLRLLSRYRIPEEKMVQVMDHCFRMLTTFQAAAIKVHAMEILYRLSHRVPEIKHELASAIEMNVHEGTKGVKNRGTKMLKKLQKEMAG
jgi:hypothetical protein